tara:strand:+ start:2079 stop:3509 length:1431 start_codon:yes stop_codon:yes gene_type:complete
MKQVVNNRTKIIATIGPSSSDYQTLTEMVIKGVDVVRLNFSHGSHKDHKKVISNVRKISDELGVPITILQDLQGPKIRVGKLEKEQIVLKDGNNLSVTSKNIIGNQDSICIDNNVIGDIKIGEKILIDDGKIELKVVSKEDKQLEATVVRGGVLLERKGVNLPESDIKLSSVTEKDIKDLNFGLKNDVDWIALSFVRSAKDILELKNLIKNNGYSTKVIAKIEKPQAIKNIDDIITESDGLMVARGDLGVEVPMETVPIIQKKIVDKCNLACKPVIIATQMLESMITSKTPTRAESNDVANAVLDGTDAVMLSAESATGKYPLLAVESMSRIINSVEKTSNMIYYKFEKFKKLRNKLSESLITTACRLSKQINAKAIVTMTKSGYSAFRVSGSRPKARIYIVTNEKKIGNEVNLVWGIRSIYYNKTENIDSTLENIEKILLDNKHLDKGDKYIITSSMPTHWKGHTNMMKLNVVNS